MRKVALPSESTWRSVRLGKNLYVNLVTARPRGEDSQFPVGVIAYDMLAFVESDSRGGITRLGRFSQIGLLGNRGIAYRNHRVGLPTFVISDETWQPLLHGSCRKLHGRDGDRSKEADLLLGFSATSESRPAVLFLTGDQIYADDVSSGLVPIITRLGRNLVGNDRTFSNLPPDRSSFCRQLGFTSGDSEHHLLSLGEFAAMYALTFSPHNWPRTLSSETLRDAKTGVFAAHRLLANMATYMIFDDHEVTDDWNITKSSIEVVKNNRLTRKVVGNALCAYWAFQDWGNDPSAPRHELIIRQLDRADGKPARTYSDRRCESDMFFSF